MRQHFEPQGQLVSPRARLLAILAGWQCMAVVLGYLTAGLLLKHCNEFSIKAHLQDGPVLTRMTLFVRDFGFWFVCAPLLWLAIALRPRRGLRDAPLREPSYLGGILMAVLLTVVFAVATVHAFWMLLAPVVT